MDAMHRQANALQPNVQEGASLEATSVISPNFTLGHSFKFAQLQHNAYTFMTNTLLHGSIDHDANLSARCHYTWQDAGKVKQITKLEAQLAQQQNMFSVEHEITSPSTSLHLRMINPNPIDTMPKSNKSTTTGIFSATLLQTIVTGLQVGAEYQLQKPTPTQSESAITYSLVFSPPPCVLPSALALPESVPSPFPPTNPMDATQVYTATYSPNTGLLQTSYFRRLNARHEVSANLQALMTPGKGGRREGVCTLSHKVQTIFASVKSLVDTTGRVASVVEWAVAPGLMFNVGGEVEYGKGQGGVGKVSVGFSMEM